MATPTFFLPHEALANEPTLLDRIAKQTAQRALISRTTREEDVAQRTAAAYRMLEGIDEQPTGGYGALFGQRAAQSPFRTQEDAAAFLRATDPQGMSTRQQAVGEFMANQALPRLGTVTDPAQRVSVLREMAATGPAILNTVVSKIAADGVITDEEMAQAMQMYESYKKPDQLLNTTQGVYSQREGGILPGTAPPPKSDVPSSVQGLAWAYEHRGNPAAEATIATHEANIARLNRSGRPAAGGGGGAPAGGPGGQSARDKIWAAQHANDPGPNGVAARAILGSHAPPATGQIAPDGAATTGAAFLATLPKNTAALVRGLAEGRQAFPTGAALRSEYWQQMLNMVAQYDPQFDAANAPARYMTRRDFTSGLMSRNVTALNTVMGHLDSLESAVDALDNSDFPAYNAVANWAVTATGDPRVRRLNLAKTAVADELERVFRGTGGTLEGTKNWQAQFDAASSPEQLRVAVQTAVELVRSRLEAVGDAYSRGMGLTKNPIEFLNPRARQAYDRLVKQYEVGLQSAQPGAAAPQGGHPADIQDILRRHSGRQPGG
jgi:hypothetical protein